MSQVGSVPSDYPYILWHILSRYGFKHVFEAVAADNPAGVSLGDDYALSEAVEAHGRGRGKGPYDAILK